VVTTGYFESLGIPLVEGRTFDESDVETGLPAIIIDRRLARKFWPDQSAIGRRMFFPSNPQDLMAIDENTRFFTVVGVVGEVKQRNLVDLVEPVGAYYFPYQQDPRRGMTIAIRSGGSSALPVEAFRRLVQELDPELPVYDVLTMDQRINSSLSRRRTPMLLSLGFAGVALFLAAVGIYGVLGYLVSQRAREIGIRIALGSDRRSVFSLVLRQGIFVLGSGLLLGGAGFALLSRYLAGSIYGVSAFDPLVISVVAAVLGAVALTACLGPARRATRIDPVRALNS
jgi:predicted permease